MENIIEKLLQDFERGKMNRRQLVQSLAVAAVAAAPAAAESKGFKAVAVNHISYEVADYAKTRDFYADLFAMKVLHDEGKGQCYLAFGDSWLLPRNIVRGGGRAGAEAKAPEAPPREPRKPPLVDHIAYTIDTWNKDQVEEELKRRGLKKKDPQVRGPLAANEYRPDTENSFHILDPDGFDVQISGRDMKAGS
jgi:catechol 2,3-dioxygenase-like lactoylglutathione lyase family enzyme